MRRIIFNISLILIIVVTCLTPLVTYKPVYALTDTLTVSGEGVENEFPYPAGYSGGASNYTNLNSNDGDTTIYLGYSDVSFPIRYHSWAITDSVVSYSSISNVNLTIVARGQIWASKHFVPYVYIGGTRFLGTQVDYSDSPYITFSQDWSSNPATGNPWQLSEINNAEFGFGYQSDGYYDLIRCTYLSVVITYAPVVTPTVSTSAATGILYDGAHKATLNGSIDATGGVNADFRGFEWGTTSNTTAPASTQSPRTTPYSANYTESGSFGVASFSYQITAGLAAGTTYYFRAYAHNSAGWSYGSELSFTTLTDPDITTQAATYVSATTVRLNALVINDGGQLADIRFGYSTASGNCTDGGDCSGAICTFNATSYNATTPWVLDTYATGSQPYVDLSGLVVNKTYYFCVQIRNDISCRCGGQLSFTTSTGVSVPTNLKGIPTDTTISLLWTKAAGSTNTLIRYKANEYPTGIADGILGYLDNKNSIVISGLSRGESYYFMAWGESGGLYSSNTTLIVTTLAGTLAVGALPTPTTSTSWFQSPDYTKVSNVPFYGMINWWADSFQIPRSTLWFMMAIFIALCLGVLSYKFGGQKIIITYLVVLLSLGFSVSQGLVSMWLLVPFILIGISTLAIGERV
jgi:hypothetical protein